MNAEITSILDDIQAGNESKSSELLPLVYRELRELARARIAREKNGHTLDATALVHEAYLRLVGNNGQVQWNGRAHFFGAAAEAMRRILVEHARRRKASRHGGDANRITLHSGIVGKSISSDRLLDLDEAINQLSESNEQNASLAKLILFTGLSVQEASEVVGISTANGYRKWKYTRAFLRAALDQST